MNCIASNFGRSRAGIMPIISPASLAQLFAMIPKPFQIKDESFGRDEF
jgi:hypothetical protein